MEHKITATAAVIGWVFGMVTKNWIAAIILAGATGAAGYVGQQCMKYLHGYVKRKYKSITIKFKR